MYVFSNFSKIVEKILPSDSKEYELLSTSYNLLLQDLPTSNAQAHSRLSALDTIRPQLSALVYMISFEIESLRVEHDSVYNKDYTKWCNSGTKPSHAAIEAQVYKDSPDLMIKKYKIDSYLELLDLVKSLIRSVDSSRQSVIQAWKDSSSFS